MSLLNGKTAIITGGSSGIGLATAKRFVAEGAFVFITGRRQTELDKAVNEIGKNVSAIAGDISKLEDLDRIYKTVAETKRKLDIVVASAGFVGLASTMEITPEHFDQTFDINARGTFFTIQKALPLMNDGGSIVLIGSGVYVKGFPNYLTYAATKAALRSYVRTWTTELKDRKIRANIVTPGMIETPIIDAQFPEAEGVGARAYFSSITPLGRLGLPEEVAAAVLFLASSESSYIAGIDLPIDGGITAV
ncbi:SDR family NAD(P)-dependent oxidoreductase [Granulicella arctica]|uniref:SDR family NAD(P)-dependent oxidoreductase n=1 Tax=Granulicella arctica TaxID=940613 RepID=UPI0021E0AAC7|nr:SDR family oxidoreductase [Granulicella arctica]